MKTFIRRALGLCGAVALLFGITANAQTFGSGTLTNGVNLIRSGGTALLSMQLINGTANAQMVLLFDNNSATSTNIVRPEYMTSASTLATNTSVFTNIFGQLQTNSFKYLSQTITTNAAVTNAANVVYQVLVPANGTVSILPSQAIGVSRGLNALNGTNTITYTYSYFPLP